MPIEIRKIVKESALILNVGIMVLVSTVILRYAIIPQIVLLRSNVSQYRSVNALISSEAGLTKIIGDIKTKNDRLQKNYLPTRVQQSKVKGICPGI